MSATIAYYKSDHPKVHGNITIKDHEYALESALINRGDRNLIGITLTKQSDPDTEYTVYRSNDGDLCLSGNTNAGWECDCGDFLNRHAGTATLGCKHIQAIVAEKRLTDWITDREEELNAVEETTEEYESRLADHWNDRKFDESICSPY